MNKYVNMNQVTIIIMIHLIHMFGETEGEGGGVEAESKRGRKGLRKKRTGRKEVIKGKEEKRGKEDKMRVWEDRRSR